MKWVITSVNFNILVKNVHFTKGGVALLANVHYKTLNNFTKCVSSAYPSLGNIEIHSGEQIKPKK